VERLPQRPDRPGVPVPERKLSQREFELVIRRAAELQARAAEEGMGDEGVSEGEMLRIGSELGLSGSHLSRALAEVRGTQTADTGLLTRYLGDSVARATRSVLGGADDVRRTLEAYLTEREYLAVLRRLPDRTIYTRASGVAAAVGRATSQMVSRSPLLKVSNLEVSVQPLEEGFSYVMIASSLATQRTSTAAVGVASGVGGGSLVAAVLGIAVAPPAALIGIPFLASSLFAAQQVYHGVLERTQTQLESLLDRLEHGELLPAQRWPGRR
jgi:hypothetical protein